MTQDATPRLDAQFEGLLREAAAHPLSPLLRMDRPAVFASLRTRERPIGVTSPGLAAIERELLHAHRCDLGHLLRRVAVALMLDPDPQGGWIDRTITDGRSHETTGIASACADARAALRGHTAGSSTEHAEVVRLVADLLGVEDRRPSVLEVAAAALRVEPSDEARIYAATHLATRGEFDSCRRILTPDVLSGMSALNEVFAREGLALAHARCGDAASAMDVLLPATKLEVDRAEVWLRLLFYALMTGVAERVAFASTLLEQAVSISNPRVESFCVDLRTKIRRGQWKAHRHAQPTIADPTRLGAVSARVFHALSTN